jgi:tetratricopeptide (TPR) repeat protein
MLGFIIAAVLVVIVLSVLLMRRRERHARLREVAQLRERYPEDIAFMEWTLGMDLGAQLEYVKATLYLEETQGVKFRELYESNAELARSFWVGVGRDYAKDGNHAKAAECFGKALAIALRDESRWPEALAELRCEMGVTLNTLHEHDRAIELFEKSLAYHREKGQPECREVAILLHNIGWSWQGKGDAVQARALHTQALALCQKIGLAEGIEIVSEKMRKLK